jgi:hypothetical protein
MKFFFVWGFLMALATFASVRLLLSPREDVSLPAPRVIQWAGSLYVCTPDGKTTITLPDVSVGLRSDGVLVWKPIGGAK